MMKTKNYSAVLGLAIFMGATCLSTMPSLAGGMYGQPMGGMKDSVVVENGIAIPAPTPMEETATWYLRGDLGFGWHGDTSSTHKYEDERNINVPNFDIDSTLAVSLGIGYYFTQNLRSDLTLDFRTDAETSGYEIMSKTNEGPDLNNTTLLANLYYDFRPSSTFSPYIGGGIGLAFNNLDMPGSAKSYTYTNKAGEEVSVVQTTRDDENTEFAAMATAGVNIALRENLFLDIGYRYSYIGEANLVYERVETIAANGDVAAQTKSSSNTLTLDHMDIHELKIGLRYDLY